MKLNHLNLTVTDVPLGKVGKNMGFLTDENGIVLSVFRADEVHYPEGFHIGFIQASEAEVDEINARLEADGYDVPPPSRQHGSWTFYMEAPGGFTVAVLS